MSEPIGQWHFYRITAVERTRYVWTVQLDDGFCVSVPPSSPVEPRVGDRIGLWTRGTGYIGAGLIERMTIGEALIYDVSQEPLTDAILQTLWRP